jgi:hypothetical protein
MTTWSRLGNSTVSQLEFTAGLEQELRLRGVAFSRAGVMAFADDVWPLAQEDPDPVRWADAFVEAGYAVVKA